MAEEKKILSRVTQSLEIPVNANKEKIVSVATTSFCDLLRAVYHYYFQNPLTPLPERMEIKVEQENLDVRLWIVCYGSETSVWVV